MGVRHLYTFISKTVSNGTFSINISDEVEKFKRDNPETTPIIIVDLLTIHSKVYTNNHEILIGGRYNLYNERTYQMFNALKSLNAKIIYFCDGPSQPNKLKTCLERRNSNYNEHVKLLHAIDDGLDLSGDLKGYHVQNLTQFFQNTIDIAKQFGELYMSTLNECDQEIAYLANQLNALAIISNDTDFLIYDGKWKFWSANDINFHAMQTIQFNKIALRETLALSSRQMALFGTLGGNDILTYEMVQDYHNRIAPRGGKFYKIANEVRHMRSLPPRLNSRDENYIIRNVLRPQDRYEGIRNLRDSLDIYCYNGMHHNGFRDNVLETVSKDPKRFNFVILYEQEYILNLVYFDLSKNFFMPYYDLIKQLLRRCMGILLQHKQHLRPIRKFYCKITHERPYELITERPEYPPCQLPSILKLLYHPYGEDNQLDQLRLDLFCWQISSKLNRNIISKLPKENLIAIIAIFYLVELKQISIDEADCLLLASNCSTEIRDSLNLNEMKKINGRDARLAFLFPRICNIIYNCLAAVGLQIYCSLLTFDGLYFHYLRKKCKENSREILNDEIVKYQHLRIYS